ncbi:IS66 family insertion sequence element accessory protein TnpB [Tropicibacter oceani]|uniref:IS66 family insertion sequence element accessory protein TnpB n=1 Tax=Tropicibacter oceani TaxID=3058420 RepID=A0ABY8QI05_9RHOB|nr:IS66 family insertion sequence element accessory protein TnpB [Tropicibacter oceani]WGW03621.1 IS66 family insertion sequence element accessory protein TnpB [Tropicibacter oceani]
MIFPANGYRIFMATAPVDFRKGMDGLAAHVTNQFDLDPYSGAFFVFRSKSGDKIKVLMWDGTGLVLIHKRLNGRKFVWPSISGGTLNLSKTQFEALFEGIDWRRVVPPRLSKPSAC